MKWLYYICMSRLWARRARSWSRLIREFELHGLALEEANRAGIRAVRKSAQFLSLADKDR